MRVPRRLMAQHCLLRERCDGEVRKGGERKSHVRGSLLLRLLRIGGHADTAKRLVRRLTGECVCHRCLRIEGTTGSAGATPSARAQRSARRALIAHERCSMMAGTSHSARSGWPKSVREGKGGGAGNVWAAPAVQDCTAEAKRPCLGSGRSGGQLGACGRAPRARGVRACSFAAVGTTAVPRPRSVYSRYTCCEAVEHPPAV